jgi:hypothetical protein|tara:strand:+ start:178 stop:657 length:480 start_codon:yes stop_codon:yes gene_type:complete
MKEIIIAMMMWIHTATGYSIPEIPDINYLNTMELRSYAYGCELTPIPTHNIELCAAKKDWDLDRTNPIAIYDNENKTIIVNKKFDIETIHDKSVLFHELVHHMQFENDIDSNVECIGDLEKEAYTLQDEWLQEKYSVSVWDTIKMNRLFFMMITSCNDY